MKMHAILGLWGARSRCVIACAVAVAAVLAAQAAPPASAPTKQARQWRVDVRVLKVKSSAALDSVSGQGATVIGTAGHQDARAQLLARTATDAADDEWQEHVIVQNGHSASLRWAQVMPLHWLEPTMNWPTAASAPPAARVTERTAFQTLSRGITVEPQWVGGAQPVRLALQLDDDAAPTEPGAAPQSHHLQTTVHLPLGEWLTVARTGGAAAPTRSSTWGTIRSGDAAVHEARLVQVRVLATP